jgi:uridine phosphorylase
MDTALILPRRHSGEPELSGLAVLALSRLDLDLLAAVAAPVEEARVRDHFRLHLVPGLGLALAGPALGAPQAVMVVEKLFALGVDRLLVLGWAGAVRPEVKIGDLLLATSAHSEEGVSTHYPSGRPARPDPALTAALVQAAADSGLTLASGPVWTTEAIYRETPAKVAAMAGLGCLAVEMEASALLTVAAYRAKALAILLVVSDDLSQGRWRPGFKDPAFTAGRRAGVDLILKAAQKLK